VHGGLIIKQKYSTGSFGNDIQKLCRVRIIRQVVKATINAFSSVQSQKPPLTLPRKMPRRKMEISAAMIADSRGGKCKRPINIFGISVSIKYRY
jgi:hypothetical protein